MLSCLRVERIQLTSPGRSSPPTSTWSSSTEPTLEHNPPMPMHHGPFSSRSHVSRRPMRYCRSLMRLTAPQRRPSQCASIFTAQGWTASPTFATTSSSSSISANAVPRRARMGCCTDKAESMRTRSGFWAAGHDSCYESSLATTPSGLAAGR